MEDSLTVSVKILKTDNVVKKPNQNHYKSKVLESYVSYSQISACSSQIRSHRRTPADERGF